MLGHLNEGQAGGEDSALAPSPGSATPDRSKEAAGASACQETALSELENFPFPISEVVVVVVVVGGFPVAGSQW